jgi:hypothetical protein
MRIDIRICDANIIASVLGAVDLADVALLWTGTISPSQNSEPQLERELTLNFACPRSERFGDVDNRRRVAYNITTSCTVRSL